MKKIILLILIIPLFLAGCTDSSQSTYSSYPNYNSATESSTTPVNDGCCKHCTTGQACGDSCISRSYTCHKPPGCACDY